MVVGHDDMVRRQLLEDVAVWLEHYAGRLGGWRVPLAARAAAADRLRSGQWRHDERPQGLREEAVLEARAVAMLRRPVPLQQLPPELQKAVTAWRARRVGRVTPDAALVERYLTVSMFPGEQA